jgi:hypothetical protein
LATYAEKAIASLEKAFQDGQKLLMEKYTDIIAKAILAQKDIGPGVGVIDVDGFKRPCLLKRIEISVHRDDFPTGVLENFKNDYFAVKFDNDTPRNSTVLLFYQLIE